MRNVLKTIKDMIINLSLIVNVGRKTNLLEAILSGWALIAPCPAVFHKGPSALPGQCPPSPAAAHLIWLCSELQCLVWRGVPSKEKKP